MSGVRFIIENLRVDFPKVIAVHDLSVELTGGDVYGLIGPNGAGKTTTMRAAMGLQEMTQGRIRLNHFDLSRDPQQFRQKVGFMPDFSPLYDQLTVTEFLEHFARAYDIEDRKKRIDYCLKLTWLMDKQEALCHGLSRGMKQRLIFAKTLLPDPQVLLLDEPASGLDPLGRIELRKLILLLRDEGKLVLISSHILSEMSEFCNKVGIMECGKLVRSGSIRDLVATKGSRKMFMKIRRECPGLGGILRGIPEVKNFTMDGLSATFDFEGNSDSLVQLLAMLIKQGVPVMEWRPLEGDLEHILLQSGAKGLS